MSRITDKYCGNCKKTKPHFDNRCVECRPPRWNAGEDKDVNCSPVVRTGRCGEHGRRVVEPVEFIDGKSRGAGEHLQY